MANFISAFIFISMLSKIRIILFSFCLLVTSLFIGWFTLAQMNFAYPLLHSVMNIDEHIAKFGPQNRYRKGFEQTNKAEQVRLFAEINTAIHNEGKGLNKLVYHKPNGQPIRKLLRKPEVVHLKDVANLIDAFYLVSTICVIVLGFLLGYFVYTKQALPSIKQQAIGIIGFSLIVFIVVMVIGPINVFYALHIWIFPENHQWFFYYQESLMTVLMKAPDLFGAIAAIIAVVSVSAYILINWGIHNYLSGLNTRLP